MWVHTPGVQWYSLHNGLEEKNQSREEVNYQSSVDNSCCCYNHSICVLQAIYISMCQ